MWNISGQFVQQSTRIRKVVSAIRTKIHCNVLKRPSRLGFTTRDSFGFKGRHSWQCLHESMTLSMQLSIPVQYTDNLARCLVLPDPWCDSWSFDGVLYKQLGHHPQRGGREHPKNSWIPLAAYCDCQGSRLEHSEETTGTPHLLQHIDAEPAGMHFPAGQLKQDVSRPQRVPPLYPQITQRACPSVWDQTQDS